MSGYKIHVKKIIAFISGKLPRVAQMVKCLPTTGETWVRSLGLEDPLEKEMATHSNILAWRIPWMEEPDGHGVAKSWTQLSDFTFTFLLPKTPHKNP